MEAKLLSVVIITYNMGHLISTALDSLRNQTVRDFEVIVVDNHSRDNTEEILGNYSDLNIHTYKISNNGILSLSRNLGIEKSSGDWVAFLDADDYWESRKVEKVLDAIETAGPEVVAITHPCKEWDTVRKKERIIGSGSIPEDLYRTIVSGDNIFTLSGTTIRKAAAQSIGGFSTDVTLRTVEDYDMWIRLSEVGKFLGIDECLAVIVLHDGNYSKHADIQMNALDYLKHKNLDSSSCFSEQEKRAAFKKLEWEKARILQKNGFFAESMKCIKRYIREYGLNIRIIVLLGLCALRIKH